MKKIDLILEIAEEVPNIVFTDEKRLKQILFNLVGNALKFTMKGFIKLKVNRGFTSNYLRFKVIDTGIGIKQEDHQKLFKLFGKVSLKKGINQNGIGLGLTISSKLIDHLGGSISLKTNEHKGTTFEFTIKITNQDDSGLGSDDIIVDSNCIMDGTEDLDKKMSFYQILPRTQRF